MRSLNINTVLKYRKVLKCNLKERYCDVQDCTLTRIKNDPTVLLYYMVSD